MTMKQWIIALVGVGIIAAISVGVLQLLNEDDDASASTPTTQWTENLQILLGSTNLSVEETRETILLRDGFQRINDVVSVTVAAYPPNSSEPTWTGSATPYHDAEGIYWMIEPEFAEVGEWTLEITATSTNGTTATERVSTTIRAEAYGVGIGEPAPASDSFTLDTPNRPDRITTDLTPNNAFYTLTVAEAVTSGRPSVIVFGTPELCTRKLWNLCGSVLDGLDGIAAEYAGRVNFLHVEIYNLDTGRYVSAWDDYGLEVSPWIYVVDAQGTVAMRYDAIVGVDELRPLLADLLPS